MINAFRWYLLTAMIAYMLPVQGVLRSLNTWWDLNSEEFQLIAVIGEEASLVVPSNENHDSGCVEECQCKVFIDGLKAVSASQNKVTVLLDSSSSFVEHSKKTLAQIKKHENCNLFLDIHTEVSLFAHEHANEYGALNFIHVQDDNAAAFAAYETINVMDALLTFISIRKKGNEIPSTHEFDFQDDEQKNKFFKNKYTGRMQELLLTYAPMVTCKEYLNALGFILEKSSREDYLELQEYYQKAHEFFVDENIDIKHDPIGKALWLKFKRNDFNYFKKQIVDWIKPLHEFVELFNFYEQLKNNFQTCQLMILYCKHPLAIRMNKLLEENGFKPCLPLGHQELLSDYDDKRKACSIDEIKNLFQEIIYSTAIPFNAHYCSNCLNDEKYYKQYKSCTCRKIFYCSKECQTKDWRHHKKKCHSYQKN